MMETYNREFNEKMGEHPSLFVFCDQLDTEIKRWVRKVEQARKGVMTERQGQASIQWPAIPNDFATFLSSYVPPNKMLERLLRRRLHALLNDSVLFLV